MSVSDMRIEADVRIAAGSDSPRSWGGGRKKKTSSFSIIIRATGGMRLSGEAIYLQHSAIAAPINVSTRTMPIAHHIETPHSLARLSKLDYSKNRPMGCGTLCGISYRCRREARRYANKASMCQRYGQEK